jgi:O-antigen/teichoic acid export membrane protein
LGQRLLATATSQGDYIVIASVLADKVVLGLYAHAFLLATQVLRMLCDNVGGALLPALNAIQDDPQRVVHATLRSNRALVALIAPLATVQIVLAPPLVHLLYIASWQPMVPLIQWLSVGTPFLAMAWPFGLMLIATGRFKRGFLVWIFNLITFFALVLPLTIWLQARGTAIGVSLWSCVAGFCLALAALGSKLGVRAYIDASWKNVLASVCAGIPGAVIVWFMPRQAALDAVTLVTAAPMMLAIYYFCLRALDREIAMMLQNQFTAAAAPILRPLSRLVTRSPQMV